MDLQGAFLDDRFAEKPWNCDSLYNREVFRREARQVLSGLKDCSSLEMARGRLVDALRQAESRSYTGRTGAASDRLIRTRDCAQVLSSVLNRRSESRCGFSVAQAFWDLARGRERNDLHPGFYAEMINWIKGLEGRAKFQYVGRMRGAYNLSGRSAAIARSQELDKLSEIVQAQMARFGNGLSEDASRVRLANKRRILAMLGANEENWNDWKWQTRHRITDGGKLRQLVSLSSEEYEAITRARRANLPFAVTPYYVSLMDNPGGNRDLAIRAQVIPPHDYIDRMLEYRDDREHSCDFMLESDTSPIDLVTRRYTSIAIFKPYMTCPQICVYCQRNWEIQQAMAPGALADDDSIQAAVEWIRRHPAIREVLVTGGDPLTLDDRRLEEILSRLAELPSIDLIRIGTRTPVTSPMRITEELASMLGSFREIGRRDIAVVTHIEHPYEVTMDTARAVDRLKRCGISVYNQQVYTFFVSRRLESAMLRMLIRRIGVDPYYTFTPKGKEETAAYRVPIARILQEQKEEARLLPGLRRTDEAVCNLPGLGKNYLRARQHRDLITVLPDGARVYEFHPWEKNLAERETCLLTDVPILDYLVRLADIGEEPRDYSSIWFYY
jgi:lysine 2,3-aminomutase